jgi:hypothetical protein
VVERAIELVEAMCGGKSFVGIAQMVLAELRGRVTPRLEQLGDGDIARLQAFLCAGQTDLEIAGAEANLAGEEGRTPGGAALLTIPVGEERPFLAMLSMFGVL